MDISVKATLLANQVIATGVTTLMLWTTEAYDTDGMHDTAVNIGRITIRTAGKFLLTLVIIWGSNNVGVRQLAIYKNGAYFFDIIFPNNLAGEDHNQIFTVENCIVGDYFEAFVYQASGGNLAVLGPPVYPTTSSFTAIRQPG